MTTSTLERTIDITETTNVVEEETKRELGWRALMNPKDFGPEPAPQIAPAISPEESNYFTS